MSSIKDRASSIEYPASRMRNIKLVIEYDGTNYHGWQLQPGLKTIQGVLESRLSRITKTDVTVYGAGRTDAGVHALGQVANFRTDSRMTQEEFRMALNSALPVDIVIKHVQEVEEDFHARYDAVSRTYRYTILNEKMPSAFLRNYVYQVPYSIDVDSMAASCKALLGTHDFSSFASTGDPVRDPTRTVTCAGILQDARRKTQDRRQKEKKSDLESGVLSPESLGIQYPASSIEYRLIHFQIEANAFLRCMVRAIAGTLLEIGKGKMPPEKMLDIMEARDRRAAGPNLPGKGLYLVKVDYPEKGGEILELS